MSKIFTRATVSGSTLAGSALKSSLTTLWDALNSFGITDSSRATVTTSATLVTTQCGLLLVDCTSGNITLTLPTSGAATDDAIYNIRRIDSGSNTLSVQRGGTDTLEGATTAISIAAGGILGVQMPAGGTNWRVTNQSNVTSFVQGLLSSANAAAARATLEVITRMPYVAGRYYTAPFNMRAQQGGSLTVASNTLYLIPYRQEITGSMAALSIAIGTGAAGNVRLGLYADSAGTPGALIATAGTISTSTTGVKDVAYTANIPAGNYWLAAQFDAAPSVNVYDGTLSSPQVEAVLGLPGGANFTLDFYLGYSVAATYASGLPASITSPTLIYKVPVIAAKA